MLTRLQISHFALIQQIDCAIETGFTVITGETGAGKSLLIQAIRFALGQRFQSQWLSQTGQPCVVHVHFNLSQSEHARQWLGEQGFVNKAQPEACVVMRKMSPDHRAYQAINGHACTLKSIKQLSQFLLSFHGQHDQRRLLDSEQALFLLDSFAGTLPERAAVNKLYSDFNKTRGALAALDALSNQSEDKQALLRYQLEELEALNLQPSEWDALHQTHQELSHGHALMQAGYGVLKDLQDGDNFTVLNALNASQKSLTEFLVIKPSLSHVTELIEQANIYVQEAYAALQSQLESVDIEPQRLEEIEKRLDTIHALSRKHKVKPQELMQHEQYLKQALQDRLANSDKIDTLREALEALRVRYNAASQQLSEKRLAALPAFNDKITHYMSSLGMSSGIFSARCIALDDEPHPYGQEQLMFYVSTNPGQPLAPLSRIVSGGELSRISLIIEVVTQQTQNIPTLLFDEVDVGVSGAIAEVIGRLLRQLGDTAQVLCITHLPQVAVEGRHHLGVEKIIHDNAARVSLRPLNGAEKTAAISSLLGSDMMAQLV